MKQYYDVAIIGAGAAGLMAAASALKNNKHVIIFDLGNCAGRKISISGGGRCNFTNTNASIKNYFGQNQNFVRSVLAQNGSFFLLDWAKKHGLNYTQKKPGQYFCASGASDILSALLSDIIGAKIVYNTPVSDITHNGNMFLINNTYLAHTVIIATGGISFNTLGTSDFGYQIAKKFGHKIIPPRPALCPIITKLFSSELSGITLPVAITIQNNTICDSLLFTHFGIGGPAAYRTTIYDINTNDIHINFLPAINLFDFLKNFKKQNGKRKLNTILSTQMPTKLANWLTANFDKNIADYKDSTLKQIAENIQNFLIPVGHAKYYGLSCAEVTSGGVSTEHISSKTLESKLQPGLFFVGEVLDITGDLGGFNLHWAFASGNIAGQNA